MQSIKVNYYHFNFFFNNYQHKKKKWSLIIRCNTTQLPEKKKKSTLQNTYGQNLIRNGGSLQERIISTKEGSITSIQVVYVLADDLLSNGKHFYCHMNSIFISSGKSHLFLNHVFLSGLDTV